MSFTTLPTTLNRINYYKSHPMTMQTMKTLEYSPFITGMSNFDIFHRDFQPSKALSSLYNHFNQKIKKKPNTYKIIHSDDSDESGSWLNFLNPFGCDSESSDRDADDEDDDYDDLFESNEYRKSKKFIKHKKKKKLKKKKKKILIKFVVGFLAFIALKFLFEKLWLFVPTIFPTTARDELLNEVDLLLDEGIELDRADEWRKAREFEMQNRAFFAPNYEETRIDVTIMPVKRKIFANF